MNLLKGREVLDAIEQTRKEINHEKQLVDNANFRISKAEISSSNDMWIVIKKEHELKLQQNIKKLEILYQKFYLLKSNFSESQWNLLLELLGFIIAKTENVNHVQDSIFDETELKKAIDQTELAMEKCFEMLSIEENEDALVVINSQLKYYEDDMKNHHWGEERLKQIKNIYEKKDENFFRI